MSLEMENIIFDWSFALKFGIVAWNELTSNLFESVVFKFKKEGEKSCLISRDEKNVEFLLTF